MPNKHIHKEHHRCQLELKENRNPIAEFLMLCFEVEMLHRQPLTIVANHCLNGSALGDGID